MSEKVEKNIFKSGSTTYYWSARFFPKKYRKDIFALYSFVRTADNYVDIQPAQPKKILELEKMYQKAISDPTFEVIAHGWDDIDTRVIKNIVRLSHKYKFDQKWVEAFFWSMKQDIDSGKYATIEDSLRYVHGSAEVIGLMMAKIMAVPEEAFGYAELQGRAMQWINFIRDIAEDNQLGRLYFPREDLKKYGLKDLSQATAEAQKADFRRFMNFQLKRYRYWQDHADQGIKYIPLRLRSPLKTANEMYAWTAAQIDKDPFIVFDKKVKPAKFRVLVSGTKRAAKHAGKILTKQETIVSKK